MMTRDVILWGGKSQAIVLRSVLARLGKRVVAIFDDTPGIASPFPDVPIYEGAKGLERWLESHEARAHAFAVAVGNPHGRVRLRLHESLAGRGFHPLTIVDPAAVVDPTVEIGVGAQIFAGAIVSSEARLGVQSIVNCGALVEHEAQIGDGVEVGPAAVVLGLAHVDSCATIGARATVLARTRVGADALVGACAVVGDVVPANEKVFGPVQRAF